jgi:hypothetical protein
MGDATKIGCRGLEFEYGGLFQARRARRGPDSTLLPFHPPGRNADPTPHMDRPPVSRVKTPIVHAQGPRLAPISIRRKLLH